MRIRTTSVLSCPKKIEHKEKNKTKDKPHPYTIRGIMVHKAIEDKFNGCFQGTKYPNLIRAYETKHITESMYNYMLPDVEKILETYRKIQPTLNLKADSRSEESLNYKLNNYITLVGHPDYFDQQQLIDWKSGKTPIKKHRIQLSFYKWFIKKIYGWDVKPKILYLGDGGKMVEIEEEDARKHLQEFKTRLKKHIQYRRSPQNLPYDNGFNCTFCEYRGVCEHAKLF